MKKSELFEIMGLGPVWELRRSHPESLPESLPNTGIVVFAPEVQMVGNQPDTSTHAGLLLANILAAIAPQDVTCYQTCDSLNLSAQGRLLVFGQDGFDTLNTELKQIAVVLPTLQAMLDHGVLKASVWLAIASVIQTST